MRPLGEQVRGKDYFKHKWLSGERLKEQASMASLRNHKQLANVEVQGVGLTGRKCHERLG